MLADPTATYTRLHNLLQEAPFPGIKSSVMASPYPFLRLEIGPLILHRERTVYQAWLGGENPILECDAQISDYAGMSNDAVESALLREILEVTLACVLKYAPDKSDPLISPYLDQTATMFGKALKSYFDAVTAPTDTRPEPGQGLKSGLSDYHRGARDALSMIAVLLKEQVEIEELRYAAVDPEIEVALRDGHPVKPEWLMRYHALGMRDAMNTIIERVTERVSKIGR